MKNIHKWAIRIVSSGISLVMLAGCGNTSAPQQPAATEPTVSEEMTIDTPAQSATEEPAASEEITIDPPEQPQPSTKNNSLIKHHFDVHEYNHGADDYYNLLDDGIEFELIGQLSGTCWICASACAMMTAYQIDNDDYKCKNSIFLAKIHFHYCCKMDVELITLHAR
jgi:hypothetical protein